MKNFLHGLSVLLLFASIIQFILCGVFKTEFVISTIFLIYGLLTLLLAIVIFFVFYFSNDSKDNTEHKA